MKHELAAVESVDTSDDARAAYLAALADGDTLRARAEARRYLQTANSPTRATRFIRAQAEAAALDDLKPYRVALLSSFSIEFVEDALWVRGFVEGLNIDIYRPGYDLYRQEILAPDSGLYRFEPDAVVWAVDGPRWAPALYDEFISGGRGAGEKVVADTLADISNLVRSFRAQSNAAILCHTLLPPRFPDLGILDALEPDGQSELIARVNSGLAGLARSEAGFYPVDLGVALRDLGYREWHDPRLAFMARSPIARQATGDLAALYMRYIRALTGRNRKCLVLDLDNTLWGGVLGDEGPLGVALGSEYPGSAFVAFQHAVLRLRERGIILAIASKNNESDVEELFERNSAMVLKPEHFAARQIHWEPKSLSLKRIADELNIGLEHIVFADDNPAECAEVSQALPEVTTILLPRQPEQFIEAISAEGLFDSLALSAEDLRRAELYRQRAEGEKLRESSGSLEDYYLSLDMTVHLAPVTAASLARASQMTQKTNQFNTTTQRYSEAEISDRMASPDWTTVTARVTDRFGDNGIVCLAMGSVANGSMLIDTFLMSCRVIGRTVETAVLGRLVQAASAEGAKSIEGWIYPTKRNTPVRDLYRRHGFTLAQSGEDGAELWRLDLEAGTVQIPSWLKVVEEGNG